MAPQPVDGEETKEVLEEPFIARGDEPDPENPAGEGGAEGGPGGEKGEGEGEPKKKSHASFMRLMRSARPEYHLLAWGTVALFIGTLSTMAFPIFLGRIVDAANDDDEPRDDRLRAVAEGALMLLVVTIVGNFFSFIRGVLFTLAGERVVARVRVELFDRILAQETSFFDGQKTGDLLNRLSADCSALQSACTVNVSMGLRFAAQALLSFALLLYTSWRLTLVIVGVIPVVVGSAIAFGRFLKRVSKAYQDALASAAATAQESLSGLRTVRSFGAERLESKRYDAKVYESYALGAKRSIAYGGFAGFTGAMGMAAAVCVLWYGGSQVVRGDLSAGELSAFLVLTVYIAFAIGGISNLFTELMNAIGASERVYELIDRVPAIPDGSVTRLERDAGEVCFEGVGVRYPTRPDRMVLDGFTLRVAPRETVAIVGASGSGKSTLLNLMQRLYVAEEGRITIGGADVRDLDESVIRRHVAVVAQEPMLFSGSLRENVLFGVRAAQELDRHLAAAAEGGAAAPREMPWRRGGLPAEEPEDCGVSQAELDAVARSAQLVELIRELPEGWDTVVGERGVKLSGGEKQRVAIARCLLKGPSIVVLDEATSALDTRTERSVQAALQELGRDRTQIVVAHRLSTVMAADKILVLREGRVVEQGTHAQLVALEDGEYAAMWEAQRSDALALA